MALSFALLADYSARACSGWPVSERVKRAGVAFSKTDDEVAHNKIQLGRLPAQLANIHRLDGSSRRGLEEFVPSLEADDKIGPWNMVELGPWPPGTVPPPNQMCYHLAQGSVLDSTNPDWWTAHPLARIPSVSPLAANSERSLLDFANRYTTEVHCGWHVQCDASTDVVVMQFTSFHVRFLDYLDLHSGKDSGAPWIASVDEDDVAANPTYTYTSSNNSMYISIQRSAEHGAEIFETHGFQAEYWCESRDIFVWGCTNHEASNYDPSATADDGSCINQLGDVVLSAMLPSQDTRALFVQNGWIRGNDPCRDEWRGVMCDARGRITDISFVPAAAVAWNADSAWVQTGQAASPATARSAFPASATNQLEFELGAETLGDLTDLRRFTTGFYQFRASGTIPHTIGNLARLKELVVIGGYSGTLPPEIVRCTNLAVLRTSFTRITGSLPDIFAAGRMETFENYGGRLSGTLPLSIGESRHLYYLNGNEGPLMSGTLPSSVSSMRKLEFLGLGGNALSGTLPQDLGSLHSLNQFSVGGNQISGTIPETVGAMKTLRSPRLYNEAMRFWGADTESSLQLSNLKLSGEQNLLYLRPSFVTDSQTMSIVTGTLPASLGGLTSVAEFSLVGSCCTSGTLPENLDLKMLRMFLLGDGAISGAPFCFLVEVFAFCSSLWNDLQERFRSRSETAPLRMSPLYSDPSSKANKHSVCHTCTWNCTGG